MAVQPGLCRTWSETPKTGFLRTRLNCYQTQKEHYLNYLRVFRGDSRNIFEKQKKAPVRVPHPRHLEQYGQSPFPGITDAAAVAMAAALTRSQQPQTHTGKQVDKH